MAVQGLRAQRKKQVQDLLVKHGYSIVKHQQNRLHAEIMFQIALNKLAEVQSTPIDKIYHRLLSDKNKILNSAREIIIENKPSVYDERVVCMLYASTDKNVRNVQDKLSDYNPEKFNNNTNVVVNQTNKPNAPDDISSEDS